MIRKCGLFALSFVALLTASFTVFSDSASAASIYDNALITTTDTTVKSPSGDPVDVSTTWVTKIQEACGTLINYDDYYYSLTRNTSSNGWSNVMVTWILKSTYNNTNGQMHWISNNNGLGGSISVNTGGANNFNYTYLSTYGAPDGDYKAENTCNTLTGSAGLSQNMDPILNHQNNTYLILSTYPVEYPTDYTGPSIPDRIITDADKEQLKPDYSFNVSTTGELSIKYLGNINPFLTGLSFINLNKMTNKWENLDAPVGSPITVNPAGWLDEKMQLPSEGYYIFNISHNQQLDSPPWPSEANKQYYVNQRWVEFYWDGKSVLSGSTQGCTESICNEQRDPNDAMWSKFNALDAVNSHGLAQFLTAPINFLATLPAKVNECSPITYPLFGQTRQLPCIRSWYSSLNPNLFAMWQSVINGAVSYLIGLNLFRIIKDINTPQRDGIEVARL